MLVPGREFLKSRCMSFSENEGPMASSADTHAETVAESYHCFKTTGISPWAGGGCRESVILRIVGLDP